MASEMELNLSAFQEDLSKISDPSVLREIFLRAGRSAALFIEENIFDYPDPFTGPRLPPYIVTLKNGATKRSWFKTAKSRKWYWAAFAQGKIQRPSRRTGFLGNSITVTVKVDGLDVVIEAGTTLEYAPYVIGELQTRMHRETGWLMLQETLEASHNVAEREFVIALTREYSRLI